MTDKPDNAALSRINELVAEEKALREQLQHGKISESEENKRLRQLEIELDQCWDLLRQRRALRETGGEGTLLEGCNTVGHLGQGIFDLQRTGDDTSGRQWERTRRMGVNTLAFRLPQHGAFYTLDADLVGITEAVPWEFNRQWLEVLAQSGTATIVSAGPPARGQEQRAALRQAFAIAAAGGATARPLDWLDTSTPERWQAGAKTSAQKQWRYHRSGAEGASAFLSP